MKNLFEICQPREDVLRGSVKESEFAADLASVLRGEGPAEYRNARAFFANTYPTAGLKSLLHNVFQRLSGAGGEASATLLVFTQVHRHAGLPPGRAGSIPAARHLLLGPGRRAPRPGRAMDGGQPARR